MNKIRVTGLVSISRPMATSETASNDLKITKEDYLGNKSCMGVKHSSCPLYYLLRFVFSHLRSCHSLRSVWFAYNDGSRKVDIWTVCLAGHQCTLQIKKKISSSPVLFLKATSRAKIIVIYILDYYFPLKRLPLEKRDTKMLYKVLYLVSISDMFYFSTSFMNNSSVQVKRVP